MRTLLVLVVSATLTPAADWNALPPVPQKLGVAGAFAGTHNGVLLFAGGANFPDKMPWDGGKKTFHDEIYVLETPNGTWKQVGKLPRPLAYGLGVSTKDGLLCIGGCDANKHYAECFLLSYKDGKLSTDTNIPPLPHACAYACGAAVGEFVYLAGGQIKPDSRDTSTKLWRLHFPSKNPEWEEFERIPGRGRILATAAVNVDAILVFGGVDYDLDENNQPIRTYLKDSYAYDPASGWTKLKDLPTPLAACPSPAPHTPAGIWLLGGDDGSQLDTPPAQHKGFPTTSWTYNPGTGEWAKGPAIKAARVTTPLVEWNKLLVIPSGEVKPGVRSPEVWAFPKD
jgi:N-acetylneuraminic acid mutarotase